MMKYIKQIPKTLLDDFVEERVVPIVGAGFSKNSIIPEGIDLPDWNQLGSIVSKYIPDYEYTTPIDAISIFESQFSRVKLIEILSEVLHINEITPSNVHKSFCDLFFDTICTTNFDFLLEHTLQETQRPHSIIVTEERLSINTAEKTKLIKLHGDFNHPEKMVITESDYDVFIEKNKILSTYMANIFITKTLLLVGYSFDDVDMRSVWKVINERLGKLSRPAYVVLVDANPIDIMRFERRNIKVINLAGKKSEYKKILNDFFVEIKAYIDEQNSQKITTTSERAQSELKLPTENKRFCFVSAPYNRIPYLKRLIYPLLESKGYAPITSDEVIMLGDSWMSKSQTLLNESAIVIVDVTENNEAMKWELVTVRNMGKKIILIEEANNRNFEKISSLEQVPHIYYNLGDDNDIFVNTLEELLSNPVEELYDEPKRLLQKKEYSAAVISVFRLLEIVLSENKNIINDTLYKRMPVKRMIDVVSRMTNDNDVKWIINKVKDHIIVRNQIVHGMMKNPGKDKATEIVEDVLFLINNIKEI